MFLKTFIFQPMINHVDNAILKENFLIIQKESALVVMNLALNALDNPLKIVLSVMKVII